MEVGYESYNVLCLLLAKGWGRQYWIMKHSQWSVHTSHLPLTPRLILPCKANAEKAQFKIHSFSLCDVTGRDQLDVALVTMCSTDLTID